MSDKNKNTEQNGNDTIHNDSKRFSVCTYEFLTDKTPMFSHWSEGLNMVIEKDGVSIKLNSEEIQQIVKALPRTFGGKY